MTSEDAMSDAVREILRGYKATGLMDAGIMAFAFAEEHQAAGRTREYLAIRELAEAIRERAKRETSTR